jgi:hypothetical protein
MQSLNNNSLLIFEPQTRGHHLSWLRYVTEDFLSDGFRLTISADLRPQAGELVIAQLSEFEKDITLISAFDHDGKWRKGSKTDAIADCLEQSGASEVFMNNFDEIASDCLRRAAIGLYPPKSLQGRLNGIYFRPRFLENTYLPPGNFIKHIGFQKLCRQKWINDIFFLDERLFASASVSRKYEPAVFHFLPDPWDGNFSISQKDARKQLNIPSDRFVFLNYGVGDKRKGLHLVLDAMQKMSPPSFLLCAGQLKAERKILSGLESLEKQGRAKIMNRYVSDNETDLCFCACDLVLLPYIRHFGSSSVLSKAAAAGKPVIVSDDGLLGERVRRWKLGLLFPSGNARKLRKCMENLGKSDNTRFQQAALDYARQCSRQTFRIALLSGFFARKYGKIHHSDL